MINVLKKCYLNLPFFCVILVFQLVFQTKIQEGTQSSPNRDDSKEVLPRIRLRDGGHLAYIERGFSKDEAKYKTKKISHYLKLLPLIPQVHQTQKICKSFCHVKTIHFYIAFFFLHISYVIIVLKKMLSKPTLFLLYWFFR
jgi:hypothetical protein